MPLRRSLTEHIVDTAYELGWSDLTNGDLLAIAEQNGYELMITTDQNLRYQQNLASRQIAIVVLLSTSWPRIQSYIEMIRDAVNKSLPGTYQEIVITR